MKHVAAAGAGALLAGGDRMHAAGRALLQGPGQRRRAMVGGRAVTVIDIHAHASVPEVWDVVKDTPVAAAAKPNLTGPLTLGAGMPARLAYMDKEGIDYQALGINPWWYAAERAVARDLVQVQNEGIARAVAAHPDRFVGMASVALQHPDLAAEQLEHAVTKLGLRGAAIGGSIDGQELADRKFDPFWAQAEKLGVMLFMHPLILAPGTIQNSRFQGKGGLSNTIGNPLETTVFLSHLIFEGTLDRFPGLKICSAHAGGYLPSYIGRSDALCGRAGGAGDDCRAIKKKPSQYFRSQLYVDSMIFHEPGLRQLIALLGVDRIFYGTDYPYDWPVGIDFIVNAGSLTDSEKTAILGGSLLKLLRIS